MLADTAVSTRGLFLRRSAGSLAEGQALRDRIVAEIVRAVGAARGDDAASVIRREGVAALHRVIDARDVTLLRDQVLDSLRNELLRMAVTVGRSVLHWNDEFYVDDYLILRINLPYEIARKTDPVAENPGIGRISPWMREIAKVRRVTDPLYDPKGYHRGHPPAAWAHGPHIDSWSGHSKDGLNIWWAIADVPAQAGMVLYPELADAHLPCDRRSLYLQAGYPLPKPTSLALSAGEMLVFDPEILHGTHLNLTDRTRTAVSLRLNRNRPRFDPACFYAREFWRRASDIEAGRFDAVLHLKREDHFAPATTAPEIAWPQRPATVEAHIDNERAQISSALVPEGGRITVQTPHGRVMVGRADGKLWAARAECPHYGADLDDGAVDGKQLYCPACGVCFDLLTGRSPAPSLALQLVALQEEEGMIALTLPV